MIQTLLGSDCFTNYHEHAFIDLRCRLILLPASRDLKLQLLSFFVNLLSANSKSTVWFVCKSILFTAFFLRLKLKIDEKPSRRHVVQQFCKNVSRCCTYTFVHVVRHLELTLYSQSADLHIWACNLSLRILLEHPCSIILLWIERFFQNYTPWVTFKL